MRPMPRVNTISLNSRKVGLLGTSALVCLALAAPVMATDFVITSSDNTINGNIGDTAIAGTPDTISLGIALTTTGNTLVGIATSGNANKINISKTGSITTDGDDSSGIHNDGDSNTTTVSGSITTGPGTRSGGIWNEGGSNKTTMSGSITTTGLSGVGIYNEGDSNTTTMSGSITATGSNADGIFNEGASNTVTISGTVSATGTGASALRNEGGSGNTFILDEGATIIGAITAEPLDNLVKNNKLTLNLGQASSYAYSVGGDGEGTGKRQWTFTDQDGRTAVATTNGTNCIANLTVCNLVTAVGSGNAIEQDELQFGMNSSMIGSLEFGSGQAKAPTEATPSTQTGPVTV